jgi:hypothetical protein
LPGQIQQLYVTGSFSADCERGIGRFVQNNQNSGIPVYVAAVLPVFGKFFDWLRLISVLKDNAQKGSPCHPNSEMYSHTPVRYV